MRQAETFPTGGGALHSPVPLKVKQRLLLHIQIVPFALKKEKRGKLAGHVVCLINESRGLPWVLRYKRCWEGGRAGVRNSTRVRD